MPIGSFAEETDATAIRMIDINLHGVIYGSKLALERFIPRNRGHLVQIASIAGKMRLPGRRHVLRDQARGRRPQRVDPRRAAGHQHRGSASSCPSSSTPSSARACRRRAGFKPVQPEDVADAIVEALQTGRFEVYVPKSIGLDGPPRGADAAQAMEAVGRMLKGDQVLAHPDHQRPRGLRVADGRDDRRGPDAFGAGLARTGRRPGRARREGRDTRPA